MHTIKVNLYSFAELEEDAKQVAIERRRKDTYAHGTGWESELSESLKAAKDLLPTVSYTGCEVEDALDFIEELGPFLILVQKTEAREKVGPGTVQIMTCTKRFAKRLLTLVPA